MKLKIYGCRGSVPFTHVPSSRYGGNTACVRVESGGHFLIIDAGSGLIGLEAELRETYPHYPSGMPGPVDILLSHLHLDHTVGFTIFAPVWAQDAGLRIHTISRGTESMKTQVFGAFKPPYWPAPMEVVANAQMVEVHKEIPFTVGPFTVTAFPAKHPDETVSFRITDGAHTLVYLLDSEIDLMKEHEYNRLVEYCLNADAVIFDASYRNEDYDAKQGWGHSTPADADMLAWECNCKKMILSHFSQEYDDETLEKMGYGHIMAYDGMEIEL